MVRDLHSETLRRKMVKFETGFQEQLKIFKLLPLDIHLIIYVTH